LQLQGQIMAINSRFPATLAAVLLAGAGCALACLPASAQDIHQTLDGFWNPLFDEDQPERIPGPDQGDYAGLPITVAAASVAQTWDPELLTIPYLQCRPHPALYGIRGVGALRIWETLDQQTLHQVAINTWIVAWEAQRVIWMDGRQHPPPWAAHSFAGYSEGHWVGDDLLVHTDMFKRGWTRRNGLPTSDQATFDERMFRDGDILTDVTMTTDPEYLSEPLVKSTEYQKADSLNFATYPCREVTEIPRHEGDIPMHLPNQIAVEQDYPVRNHVPLKASLGGAETMFPEYQDTIKTLPANPPLKQIEQQEEQQDHADENL
jgi:hypothetical protein